MAAEIGNAYPERRARQAAIDAAVLVNYGLQSEGPNDVQQAVGLATGGITERNGRGCRCPIACLRQNSTANYGGSQRGHARAAALDGNVYIDGKPMAAEEFAKQVPARCC